MPTQDLIFVGYGSFNSKKDPGKIYYKFEFISIPIKSKNGNSAYYKAVDLFVSDCVYHSFISEHDLLDTVAIPYIVVGDKVSFTLD